MKLLVLGATGPTGRQIVTGASDRHKVSVFVRNVAKARFPADVRVIRGDAFSPETIAAAVPGHDVVVSCLGASLPASFGSKGRPGAAAAGPLVAAMAAAGVRRLVVLSAMGAVDRRAVTLPFRLGIATLLSGIYADKDAMEPIVTASPLDWTIVRAANLSNAPEGPVDDNPTLPMGALAFVPRASVAAFMLRIIDDEASFRRIVYLTGSKPARS